MSDCYTTIRMNSWAPEPVRTVGVHESIALGIAEEIEKTIPCYVEGPPNPEDGWANVHVDGLGNESVTVTVWSDRILVAQFHNALGYRKMRRDEAYNNVSRRMEKSLDEPNCIDEVVRWVLLSILRYDSCLFASLSQEEKIRRLNRGKYRPSNMLLGRPYYIR